VRECHQKPVRGPGGNPSTKSVRLECRQSPCRHHQQDRGIAAFPAAPALAATSRRRRTACSSHLPRHASSICAGPPCMPVSSSKLLMGQWEHASQHKPGGRVTSSGPVSGMSLEEPFVAPSQIETKVVDAQLAAAGQIFALVVPLAVIVGGFIVIGTGRPVTGFAAIIGASSGSSSTAIMHRQLDAEDLAPRGGTVPRMTPLQVGVGAPARPRPTRGLAYSRASSPCVPCPWLTRAPGGRRPFSDERAPCFDFPMSG
jgi:hypothetical protein